MPAPPTPVLSIEHLSVAYRTRAGEVPAVVDFSLSVRQGECVGLVGESGCGKSTVALAIMQYVGQNGRITQGRIVFKGRDLLQLSRRDLRQVRGAEIAMVYQEPMAALNPSLTIGAQLVEVPVYHQRLRPQAAVAQARQMLETVHLPDADRVMAMYPHQISGGQQQRVVIAMALLGHPDLLVLDEPTTALDTTIEAGIMALLRELRQRLGTSMLFISHNLGLIREVCDRVAVMYAGEVVEEGPVDQVFRAVRHPYTWGLLQAMPHPAANKQTRPLRAIRGQPPLPSQRPRGCAFGPRCDFFQPGLCDTSPLPLQADPSTAEPWHVRCRRWQEIAWPRPTPHATPHIDRTPGAEILRLEALCKSYPLRPRSLVALVTGQSVPSVRANAAITFTAREHETVALVGESGCGKTTVAKVLIGLETATAGRVVMQGMDLAQQPVDRRTLAQRQALQMVFQHPHDTLNPSLTIGAQLVRSLKQSGSVATRRVLRQQALGLLERVQLSPTLADRYPPQLSGGQKQRVAIARAFAGHPSLVIADEPASALDVSVQAAVLELLLDMQRTDGTTLLLISHDLGVVRYLADRVVVLYLGQVMERGPTDAVFAPPYHPYTEALLAAMPVADAHVQKRHIVLEGPLPSILHPPQGCPFATRCPRKLGVVCETEPPPVQQVTADHVIACHIPLETLRQVEPVMRSAAGE
jgi:peptide/nickel transport system ATP-binding protein